MIWVICGISIALFIFGIVVLCIIPPEEEVTAADASDDDLIVIMKDKTYLVIHETNLDVFEKDGWEIAYEEEEE